MEYHLKNSLMDSDKDSCFYFWSFQIRNVRRKCKEFDTQPLCTWHKLELKNFSRSCLNVCTLQYILFVNAHYSMPWCSLCCSAVCHGCTVFYECFVRVFSLNIYKDTVSQHSWCLTGWVSLYCYGIYSYLYRSVTFQIGEVSVKGCSGNCETLNILGKNAYVEGWCFNVMTFDLLNNAAFWSDSFSRTFRHRLSSELRHTVEVSTYCVHASNEKSPAHP